MYSKHVLLDIIILELDEEDSHMILSLLSKALNSSLIDSHKQLSDMKLNKRGLLCHTSETFSQVLCKKVFPQKSMRILSE